jgi:hypothetical protein
MKPSVPVLAPLLRSDTQGRLLAELYLQPGRERTTTELALSADTALANASRELNRLAHAGFLLSRTSGRNHYFQVNEAHPLYRPVSEIVRYAYGPLAVLGPLLDSVPGIEEAFIYGSWAARLAGEIGPDPHDIDVLAIGDDIDRSALDTVAESARRQLGREINPRAVSRRAWESKPDLFLQHLRERPLINIPLTGDSS